ncbi:GNAT family N-acetyltransferase [Streptomyces sp. GXMU-J15]|uniref:GNAT family N-acetyltransferase n=1 Tax=Streptomyces fuscus TaxID=3048495 RepID=A0ABT7IZ06_9ACTN|nr:MULTISPECIES: GNAT family N-acetyltransferase [Streptomyces]MDL2077366.1 GNAT family N-acetyltransferase [Streptomyces fuscus]SBT89222.1 Acetyltransferase, GNAT family [Streptomyces sp. DI166]
MTTTLRPTEPLQRVADGTLSRHFQVCVNSRPVGAIRVSTDPVFGPEVARISDLRIEEPDRGRGRGTVAALAAEEVARGWGCRRIEIRVPGAAGPALRLATALGYVHRNRGLEKKLPVLAPALPAGSHGRPMTEEEYGPWLEAGTAHYAQSWIDRGVPGEQARTKARTDMATLLPQGLATEDTLVSVLEHEGTSVGTLWLSVAKEAAFVFDVETHEGFRGRGHGRSLMLLAEIQALAAGKRVIGLNVFAGNEAAERLYESLGYVPVGWSMYKNLI